MDWRTWQGGFAGGPGGPNPFGDMDFDLRPFLRPLQRLSPMRLVGTALAIIILTGIAVSALSSLLVAIFFLMLLVEAVMQGEAIPVRPEPR